MPLLATQKPFPVSQDRLRRLQLFYRAKGDIPDGAKLPSPGEGSPTGRGITKGREMDTVK